MLILVSDVSVDLFIHVLTGIIQGVLTNIDVNLFAGVMAAFVFAMTDPLNAFRC